VIFRANILTANRSRRFHSALPHLGDDQRIHTDQVLRRDRHPKLRFGRQQLIRARFSLSRNEPVHYGQSPLLPLRSECSPFGKPVTTI
jgi:hypothetical protein